MNEFSEEVWESTYKYNENNEKDIYDTFDRVAKALSSVEEESIKDEVNQDFYDIMADKHFCPAGRILANAGTEYKTTLYNCFTSPTIYYDCDSIEGIIDNLKIQVLTLKSEGGWGENFSYLRPRAAFIDGIGVESPGSVKFMELFNKSSAIITSGSGEESNEKHKGRIKKKKIRKGAQMGLHFNCHPDIEEFIRAKRIPNRLDKFNISVACYNSFMDAVVRVEESGIDENISLYFPDTTYKDYKKKWDGDLEKWLNEGLPVIEYKKISVKYLWDLIMKSTYDFNDPGVLFIDRCNETYLANYITNKRITKCNPCVAKGTLVNTPSGYRKVEEIKIGEEICTLLGKEKVSNIERHESVPTFKVSFSDGGFQIVTAAHIYHTLKTGSQSKKIEKIALSDLKIGDRIVLCPLDIDFSIDDKNEYERGLKSGILMGDGSYMSMSNLSIASSIDDNIYNLLVKKLFGENIFNKDDLANDGSKSMHLNMKKDSIDLEFLGLTPQYCDKKEIDYSILTNKSIILGVLDGLLVTDGNVNNTSNHPQLRWCTSSPKLAQTIKNLLIYIGCHGFIHKRENDSCGTINGRKIIRKVPNYVISISGESFRSYARQTRIGQIHPRKYDLIKYALCNFKLSGNCWNASITKIEPFSSYEVYDLYCADSDSWITGGYVQFGCGEQTMPPASVCDLGSLCLPFFLQGGEFEYVELKKTTEISVRLLDNVNDVSQTPHEEYSKSAKEMRRIGLGIMGWGSLLYLLGIRYGSDQSAELIDNVMKTIVYTAFETSADLAAEKGCFVDCDPIRILENEYVKRINLPEHIRQKILAHGLRNSALFSIQPNGNTSILCEIISGGLEPVPWHEWIRTMIIQSPPDHIKEFCPKYWEGEFVETSMFKLVKEGEESILRGVDNHGIVYKIDKNRGLTREVLCEDYAVSVLKKEGKWNPKADWAVTISDLKVEDHIKEMTGFCKWLDASCSKTVNVPKDYPYEDFKKIYLNAYKSGVIKGITTYREGTMTNVLAPVKKDNRRPRKLPCDIHHITVKGEKYYVAIGLKEDGLVYEIFCGLNGAIQASITKGYIQRIKSGKYALISDNEVLIDDMLALSSDEEESVARLAAVALRNNVDIKIILEQLEKTQGQLYGFTRAIVKILRKYIPTGTLSSELCPECKSKLIFSESCKKCPSCSWSKC